MTDSRQYVAKFNASGAPVMIARDGTDCGAQGVMLVAVEEWTCGDTKSAEGIVGASISSIKAKNVILGVAGLGLPEPTCVLVVSEVRFSKPEAQKIVASVRPGGDVKERLKKTMDGPDMYRVTEQTTGKIVLNLWQRIFNAANPAGGPLCHTMEYVLYDPLTQKQSLAGSVKTSECTIMFLAKLVQTHLKRDVRRPSDDTKQSELALIVPH